MGGRGQDATLNPLRGRGRGSHLVGSQRPPPPRHSTFLLYLFSRQNARVPHYNQPTVIISDPVICRQFFRSPRRRAGERGATDDRPPNGGPFESSMIDDDKEECVAIAVWIAIALFAVAVSVVVAGGPHPNVGTRVLRRGGGSAYARVLPASWRRGGRAGNRHDDESRNVSLEPGPRLSEAAAMGETGRKRGYAGVAKLVPPVSNPSVVAKEETARVEQSSAKSREAADEDGRATEQPILLW
ncbi:hypothetical protein MTO96_009035 [Rhipicephalus appendiculatus]